MALLRWMLVTAAFLLPFDIRAQVVTAQSNTYVGPATDQIGRFNYSAGGSVDQFTFEPTVFCDPGAPSNCDATLAQNVRYQIWGQRELLPGQFEEFWTDCPAPFNPAVTVTSGTIQIICRRVSAGPAVLVLQVEVRSTNSVALNSRTGTFARFLFNIPARRAPNGNPVGSVRSLVNTTLCSNDGNNVNCTGSPGLLTIHMQNIAPTLSYSPAPGTSLAFAAGNLGESRRRTIDIAVAGGAGEGSVSLSCSAPGFSVIPSSIPPIFLGGTAGPINVDCTLAAAPQSGTLTCVETRSTGGSSQVTWPLACPAANRAQFTSNPRPAAVAAAYGSLASPVASTTITVTNTGLAPLTVQNCAFGAGAPFALSRTGFASNTLQPAASGTLDISCTAPAPGNVLQTTLTCDTNGENQDSVLYPVRCVAPPLAMPGASASPLPRLSSPVAAAAAKLGTATAAAIGPGGEEIFVVGAPDFADGEAYVYVRAPGASTFADAKRGAREPLGELVATLRPGPYTAKRSDGIGNKFGTSVALSVDGTRIAIGAPLAPPAGVVFLYERPGGGWTDLDSLAPVVVPAPAAAGGVTPDEFGGAVQLTDTGSLVVGAPRSDVAGQDGAGAAWTFSVGGGSATPVGTALTAATAAPNQNFGAAIGTRSDLVAIGSPGEGSDTGALYVYPRSGAGVGSPTRVTRTGGAIGDKFGSSVGVGGGLIVAGSPGDDTSAGDNSGSATVLLPGPGPTVVEAGMLMPEAGDNQAAGSAVATSASLIFVGAPLASGAIGGGRAYAFQLDERIAPVETADGFYENAVAQAAGDRLGASLAIGGRRAIIGAPLADEGAVVDEGRVDPFLLDGIFRSGMDR